jgi:hypothetical protein
VWISRHSPNKRVDQHFHSPRQKTSGQKYIKGQQDGKKTLARLASGFIFLLANPEFYSHLASLRVVIRIPVYFSHLKRVKTGATGSGVYAFRFVISPEVKQSFFNEDSLSFSLFVV